jgi:hypothetical protein
MTSFTSSSPVRSSAWPLVRQLLGRRRKEERHDPDQLERHLAGVVEVDSEDVFTRPSGRRLDLSSA